MSDRLEELRELAGSFEQRRLRAVTRASAEEGLDRWYFGILGLDRSVTEYNFQRVAMLRPVVEPPGEIELATALRDKSLFSAVGRYSPGITHELAVDRRFGNHEDSSFTLAWWVISLLRVRTLSEILIPAVSDHSWSVIAGLPDSSCYVQLLEDVPRAHRLQPSVAAADDDLKWVDANLLSFAELLETPRFRTAVDALTTHHQEATLRMSIASLWTGIEALFGINSELSFRIAALAAAYLEPPGASRVSRFREVRTMYKFRSRAVHGVALDKSLMEKQVCDSRALLSSLLCRMIDLGHIPSEDEWDVVLLGEDHRRTSAST